MKKKSIEKPDVEVEGASDGPPPAILKASVKIRALFGELVGRELPVRYKIGEVVHEEQKNAAYGDRAVEMLVLQLGDLDVAAQTLRNYSLVVQSFPTAKFKELEARRSGPEKSYRLTWSHFDVIAGASDGRRRNKLIASAFAKQLSVAALRSFKQQLAESDAEQQSESTPSRDLSDAIRALTGRVQGLLGKRGPHETALFDELEKMDADEGGDALVSALSKLNDELRSLAGFTNDAVDKTAQMLTKFGGESDPVITK